MEIDRSKTLNSLITGSVGSQTWRHLYDTDGHDLLENGNLSCAYFVSSILLTAGLVKGMHATVAGCERDLTESGWQPTKQPQAGDVVFWPAAENGHRHIGFYQNDETAISNSSEQGSPQKHPLTYSGERPVTAIWTHPDLHP